MAKTHVASTLAIASLPLLWGQPPQDFPLFLLASAIGSLLPDIDEPNSFMGRRLGFLSWPVHLAFGHRTITHNLPLALIGFATSVSFSFIIVSWVFFGVVMHILGDAMTNNGVRGGMSPFASDFVILPKVLRFRVGGVAEHFLFALLAVLFAAEMVCGYENVWNMLNHILGQIQNFF